MSLTSEVEGLAERVAVEFKAVRSEFGGGPAPSPYPSRFSHMFHGRYTINNQWYTEANPNYGHTREFFTESAGGNTTPDYEWENMGLIIPPNVRLDKVTIVGRTSTSQIPDVRFHAALMYPTAANWDGGVGANSDVQVQVLFEDRFIQPTGAGQRQLTGPSDHRAVQEYVFTQSPLGVHSSFMMFAIRDGGNKTGNFFASVLVEGTVSAPN